MLNIFRLPIARILAVAAAPLFVASAVPQACAQQPLLRVPSATAATQSDDDQSSGVPEPSEMVVGGTVCAPDYWIVSGRRCQMKGRQCCPCKFDYFHAGCDGCHRNGDRAAFVKWLKPGVPVCIVAHGSFVNWNDVRHDSRKTYEWLRAAAPDRPVQFVFFDWSSEGFITYLPQIDIAILGRRSAFQAVYLSQLIFDVPVTSPLCLLGHSHGARTVAATLHLIGGGVVQGRQLGYDLATGRRIRAVFAAAAFDHHWLNPRKRYGNALCPVEGVLNLRNRLDLPLVVYPLRKPFSRRSLARAGFTTGDRRSLGCFNPKAAEVDVTWLVKTGHMWPNYYRHPEIACMLVPYVYFSDSQSTTTSSAETGQDSANRQ